MDELNRLTDVSYPDGSVEVYTYSPGGDRLTATVGGVSAVYGYDPAGQLATVTTGGVAAQYSYDEAGRLLSDGAATYGWDGFGRLTAVTAGAESYSYGFDGTDLRVSESNGATTSDLLWDRTGAWPLLVGRGDVGYVQVPGAVVGDSGVLLQDALGSTRFVTDTAGVVQTTADYSPFGTARSASGGAGVFGFTGELTDPTGLVYLRARSYQPATGRFLSRDSVMPSMPGTQGWNAYSYAGNNPTTRIDPTGNIELFETILSGAVGGFISSGLLALGLCGLDHQRGSADYVDCVAMSAVKGGVSGLFFGPLGALAQQATWTYAVAAGALGACATGAGLGLLETEISSGDETPSATERIISAALGCVGGTGGFGGGASGGAVGSWLLSRIPWLRLRPAS